MRGNNGQSKAILTHLKEHGRLTSREAFDYYGATRLSSIIFGLRKDGYIIETIMREGKTRYGTDCRFAEYMYRGKKNDKK